MTNMQRLSVGLSNQMNVGIIAVAIILAFLLAYFVYAYINKRWPF
jgi:hypothetical protein